MEIFLVNYTHKQLLSGCVNTIKLSICLMWDTNFSELWLQFKKGNWKNLHRRLGRQKSTRYD